MPHRKGELNEKRLKLLRGMSRGLNVSEAGRAAGYGTPQAAHKAFNRIRLYAPDIFQRIGVPAELVLKKLALKMYARKVQRITHQGVTKETHYDPDNAIQLQAAILCAKLHDLFPRPGAGGSTAASAGTTFDLVIPSRKLAKEIITRLAELRARRGEPLVLEGVPDEGEGPPGAG